MKKVKTNAMRLMDEEGINYELLSFSLKEDHITPQFIAQETGREVERIFKTIVTVGHSTNYYVFCLQIIEELDLKKAAKAAGEKSIALIDQKDLMKIAGYEKGGCSPVGMRKQFPTVFHETVVLFDTICVSAGKIGAQVEVSPQALIELLGAETADVIVE